MASCKAGLQLLSSTFAHRSPSAAICYQQVRYGPVVMVCECWRCTHPLRHRCGMGGVPEFWGKPSPYTEGTAFLGTPTNHDEVLWNAVVMRIESTQKVHHPPTQLVRKRPLSPDAFDINGKGVHYHFQSNAISSITNRITGVVLSFGTHQCMPHTHIHVNSPCAHRHTFACRFCWVGCSITAWCCTSSSSSSQGNPHPSLPCQSSRLLFPGIPLFGWTATLCMGLWQDWQAERKQ